MVAYPRGTDYKTRLDSLLVNGGSLTTSTVSGSEVFRVSLSMVLLTTIRGWHT